MNMLDSLKDSDLGPFAGGSYTSAKGKTIKLSHVMFKDLSPGYNSEKVVVGKVVCSLTRDDPMPL